MPCTCWTNPICTVVTVHVIGLLWFFIIFVIFACTVVIAIDLSGHNLHLFTHRLLQHVLQVGDVFVDDCVCVCTRRMILCDMLRRSIVGRTLVSAGEISLSCDRLLAGWVTTLWLRRPLSVSQHGQLSLPSLRDRLMSSNPCYNGLRRQTAQRRGERCGLPPTLPSAPN